MNRKIRRAQEAKERKTPSLRSGFTNPAPEKQAITEDGIFCDCYNTLYSHSFKKDELLVNYLNAQHTAGKKVVLISSDVMAVILSIRDIDLHPDIVNSLSAKDNYFQDVLETYIDDDPNPLQEARTFYHPRNPAFRRHMEEFLAGHPAPVSPSP